MTIKLLPGVRLVHNEKGGRYTVVGAIRLRDPATNKWYDGVRYRDDSTGEEYARAVEDFAKFTATPPPMLPMGKQQPDEGATPEELLLLDITLHAAKADELSLWVCRDRAKGERIAVLGTTQTLHDEVQLTPLVQLLAVEVDDLEPAIIADNL